MEVVSLGVWSTIPRRAKGETIMAGTRDPGPQRPPFGWCHVIPDPAIFIIRHNHHHMRPLRTPLEVIDKIGNMPIAG